MVKPATAKPVNVNLLPKDPLSESITGKILLWALSIGRYIVVFTELIVILSFVSRFSLDRELTDLNSNIDRQLNIIQSYGDLENDFKKLQDQLKFISEVNKQIKPHTIVPVIASSMPVDVILNTLTINANEVNLTGTALSTQGFANFVSSLQAKPQLRSVQLLSINSGQDNNPGITFDIKADISIRN